MRAVSAVSLATVLGAAGCFNTQLISKNDSNDGGTFNSDAGRAGAVSLGEGGAAGHAGMMRAEGGAAGAGRAGSGQAEAAPGGSGSGQSGSAHGGSGSNQAGSGQAGMAQAGAGNGSNVTWLELTGSLAEASGTHNSELGIDGTLYAYGDACAALSWDAATRCASGKLCSSFPPDFENWGVAVGFDFRNTGATGNPPNTKRVWDPRQVGALGVAWRIHGTAPGLQFWVLNMAPNFHGECSAVTCEIAGPPDGVGSASLQGDLLFNRMMKDTWAGGVAYTFDPAAVHALQFKLPAIEVGAASFNFCIDAVGIVR